MYYDKTAGVSKRLPIPIEDIRKVQDQCRLIDDEMRWLVDLISDTGLRLDNNESIVSFWERYF